MKLVITVSGERDLTAAQAGELTARMAVGHPLEVMVYSREMAPVKLFEGVVSEVVGQSGIKVVSQGRRPEFLPLPVFDDRDAPCNPDGEKIEVGCNRPQVTEDRLRKTGF